MEEPTDKRTKEYKEWKADSIGLGDVVEKITTATGIKKVVELFTDGKDCGCSERKEKLNKIKLRFPVQRCFTEDLYNQWTDFRNRPDKNAVNHQEQLFVIEVTKHLFARAFKPCSRCGTEVQRRIEQIDKIYTQYK